MAPKIEVISKEIIKPSTPTPLHLKTLKLSLVDQYMPALPISIINFYPAKNAELENELRADHLKRSLSQVLTDFYPLAGRVSGNKFIDCTDEGINFIETQVTGSPLSNIISHPEADQLTQLLPVDNFHGEGPKVLLSIQANHFECGGLAIAVSISHKVGDASSLSLFLDHWAALTRGDRKALPPIFDTSSMFPPQAETPPDSPVPLPTERLVTRRFVFNASNIEALKLKMPGNPTRVEAVGALLWGCAMKVLRMKTGSIKPQSVLSIPVDIRKRMVPPLTNCWIGNLGFAQLARTNTENNQELPLLVRHIQEAIRRVDGNYARELQTQSGILSFYALFMEAYGLHCRGELEFYHLTSWCRFPFYEADFGWGPPIWVSFTEFHKNLIGLMDSRCGQGIEAWVTLDEEDMARYECDPELIADTSTSSNMN